QYNMLNIPYELALKKGEKRIADALMDLKSYGQYIQEKAVDIEREVPLADELAHCERITAINTRRFEEVYINRDIPENLNGWRVPPLSVSALLQNAFKYGVSWDREVPIWLGVECCPDRLKIII